MCQDLIGMLHEIYRAASTRKEQAMKTLFGRFVSDQSGATGMKQALIAALFSVAIFITLGSLGSNLFNTDYDMAVSSQAER
jgi:pilus assembly protein Flp/PilA